MKRIFTSLAPNMEPDDRALAGRLLVRPWMWKKGNAVAGVERWFRDLTGASAAAAFTSGRGALYAIIKALELDKESEVLLQAFTCVAVPDPVLWAGAKPVYVDCDGTLTMSPADLERKITARSRVLIIQHTFGRSADLEKLIAIAKKHDLFVIEDCAHALGSMRAGRPLGSFGDAAFFSFGRDKALSAVFGGVAVVSDAELGKRLRAVADTFAFPGLFWIKQQLLHFFVLSFAKKYYDLLSLGKAAIEITKRLRLISKAVYPIEKSGGAPAFVFRKMPNATALLALNQIRKLDRFVARRRQMASFYDTALKGMKIGVPQGAREGEALLRYAVFHDEARDIIRYARSKRIELGDWYGSPVAPSGIDYAAVGYVEGSCPMAEKLAGTTFNLPTHIGIHAQEAAIIIDVLKKYPTV